MAEEIEDFFGVYLLFCLNEKYKGKTYIGFTVDPNRRIKQHNKGVKSGGARKTSLRGPWEMVLIVHGFPNDISALRFEWAWQNPKTSRRLKHVEPKKKTEKAYDYCIRLLSEMLHSGPWNRLALNIRWLNTIYKKDFNTSKLPPLHMPICYGPVVCKKIASSNDVSILDNSDILTCVQCMQKCTIENILCCINPDCQMMVIARRVEFMCSGVI
ncbi:structure-specific endonuclease subunit SLX1 homolog isoform X2 [Daktulosphaira vitifoliae]|uniref:structure-specific endonuclease subunit SLX1 homolog isoform X2 n=1 Tax=Daktulosphaira vitifoliae TaxID=58002 RepID=UPI0021AAF00A|nr:structure-specific endonuclease subunit SLX1 homolog isoform X2 [Daktulosphaira vitifoliae]